jgi:hypothetical protein
MKRKERKEEIRRPYQEPGPARPRQFVAPACTLCQTARPEGQNYSRIYGTVTHEFGKVRYVRCHFCGNSWTVTERNSNQAEEGLKTPPGEAKNIL